jgi:hypothetical protein
VLRACTFPFAFGSPATLFAAVLLAAMLGAGSFLDAMAREPDVRMACLRPTAFVVAEAARAQHWN